MYSICTELIIVCKMVVTKVIVYLCYCADFSVYNRFVSFFLSLRDLTAKFLVRPIQYLVSTFEKSQLFSQVKLFFGCLLDFLYFSDV